MALIDLIALLALVQYFTFSALVGRARGQYGVNAPAVTGHEMFERAYRVQMNTLELLVVFLPALYLANRTAPTLWVAATGAVYLVGRLVYRREYLAEPNTRTLGFLLSAIPCMVLVAMGLFGAGRSVLRTVQAMS